MGDGGREHSSVRLFEFYGSMNQNLGVKLFLTYRGTLKYKLIILPPPNKKKSLNNLILTKCDYNGR